MAQQGVGNTALGAAVCRLIEQYQPRETRLFDDPITKDLVGAPLRVIFQFAGMRSYILRRTEGQGRGIYGAQVCRTRYIDQAIQAALSGGIGQFVILGAGLDSRPYRLPEIEKIQVFEVDLPSVQNEKKKKIQKSLGRLPDYVTYLPIDFETQTLDRVFDGTRFDPTRPAVFLWEAVTQYLTEPSVRQALSFIGKSAPGSILLFTYVLKSVIERRSDIPDARKIVDTLEKGNAAWTFGLEPERVRNFLRTFHLSLVADVSDAEYEETYLLPLGRRDLTIFAGERTAQAVVVPH